MPEKGTNNILGTLSQKKVKHESAVSLRPGNTAPFIFCESS